jgi:hypothetical protein
MRHWSLKPFSFFASCGPRVVSQRQNIVVYPPENGIVERIEFLWRRLLDFKSVVNHAVQESSSAWRDTSRKGRSFPSA